MLIKIVTLLCALTSVGEAVRFIYPVGSTNPSIMVEAEFIITIKALQNDKVVGSFTKDTSNADEVTITAVSAPRSFMYLRFKSGVDWAFVFTEKSPSDISMLASVQFTPKNLFGDITSMTTNVQYDDPKTVSLPPSGQSYDCTHKTIRDYFPKNVIPGDTKFTVTVNVEKFKIQAYGVKDGKFGPAVHCGGDPGFTTKSTFVSTTTPTTTTTTLTSTTTTTATTSTSTTTLTPTTSTLATTQTTTTTTTPTTSTTQNTTTSTTQSTTPTTTVTTTTTIAPFVPPPATTNTYVIKETDNVTCIVFVGKVNMDIMYEAKMKGHPVKNLTKTFGIPADATATGDCTSSFNQRISIHFYGDWVLDMFFKLHASSLYAMEGKDQKYFDYSIHNMSLTYYIDDLKFPHAVQPEGTKLTVTDGVDEKLPEKTKGSSYYQCNSASCYQLGDNAKVTTSDVKFKAFNEDDDSSFRGKPMRCDADKHSSHNDCNWLCILLIIIGVFFLFVLIVVIIYLCVRWRIHNRYQVL